ncbi:ribosome biogenesis GTPase Der [Candidatus Palibaumannia cicadellinicola]|uniref:GTPase Der n=1 Tax=Candidatus Palibaumannia cicadellinicola TaxID=186490 RepID=A0A088N0P8_9GAMM|nr:ribosome biogenesis GTPase Der [Candidatus Baumannia cicadellinicola]AIN46896.1 GTP-binding protein EngA [Candidatus Baumannia cicadellinicola]
MIPVVALVGHPNVGKSTLFNRLTHTRDALVANFPGLTRDRKYGHAKWQGYKFIVIDTAGISGAKEGVAIHMTKQSLIAMEEADVILFIVDGRIGLIPDDQNIVMHLRKRQKPTFVVVNKIDGIDTIKAIGDFYSLNMGNIFPIAALHGRGINILLKAVILPLVQKNLLTKDMILAKREHIYSPLLPIKLAIVGSPNVGKSTLINRIIGEERVVVFNIPGTTRDSIYIPMIRAEREYVLIDTAGLRKRSKVTETVEKFSVIKTLQAIEDSHVVLLVIDACKGISDQELSLLSFIINSGRALVIAVNKWDGLSIDLRNQVKDTLDQRLSFIDFARVHFISALYGNNIDNIFNSVNEAYRCSTKRISTAQLTRIMRIAVNEHQPPLVRGHRVKPKYAHPGGYNPPIVVIHGNQVTDLPSSYKRYLINYFRRSLKIMGTPIRIQFNEPANPFVDSRHQLGQKKLNHHLISNLKSNP